MPPWLAEGFRRDGLERSPTWIPAPAGGGGVAARIDGRPFGSWRREGGDCIRVACSLDRRGGGAGLALPLIVPHLRDIYLRRHLHLLHAAALESPEGVGLLLVAISGGGKTTTTLALARQGFRVIADDLSLLRIAGSRVTAWGIRKGLNLTDDTIERFEEIARLPPSAFTRAFVRKRSLDPRRVIPPERLTEQSTIRVVGFLDLTAGVPAAAPMSPGRAMERLIHAHTFCSGQPMPPESVLASSHLLSTAQCWELRSGADPHRLATWLRGRLGGFSQEASHARASRA